MKISIDIGTSYSSLCIEKRNGERKLVELATDLSIFGSNYALPSAVFLEDNGNLLLGQAAMNKRLGKPERFCSEFKRLLGQQYPIQLGSRSYLPEQLYTELFRYMKKCALREEDSEIENVYITYPASYGKSKKTLIEQAAKDAGLFEIQLIDEPSAAAYDYLKNMIIPEGANILIYDFGGGTFDVSILKYAQGKFGYEVEPDGLASCGGIDMDRKIYQDIEAAIPRQTLMECKKKGEYWMQLKSQLFELAVKAKHTLTVSNDFQEHLFVGTELIQYSLTREKLNGMISPMIADTIDCCRRILDKAEISMEKLNTIVLVGGTSKIPLVKEMVKQFAKSTKVVQGSNPELAVVKGALACQTSDKPIDDINLDNLSIYELNRLWSTPKFSDKDLQMVYDRNQKIHLTDPELQKLHNSIGLRKVFRDGTYVLRESGDVYNCLTEKEMKEWENTVVISENRLSQSTFGIKRDGTVVIDREEPFMAKMKSWKNIKQIAAAKEFVVGLKQNGTCVLCGKDSDPKFSMDEFHHIVSIQVCDTHIVGLKEDGTVVATGERQAGECNVSGWKEVIQVICDDNFTIGLKKDGSIYRAGAIADERSMKLVEWKHIMRLDHGSGFVVGLQENGRVLAAGKNEYGQCDVVSWRNVTNIVCGEYCVIGLLEDSSFVFAGANEFGVEYFKTFDHFINIYRSALTIYGQHKGGTFMYTKDEKRVGIVKEDDTNYTINMLNAMSYEPKFATEPLQKAYQSFSNCMINNDAILLGDGTLHIFSNYYQAARGWSEIDQITVDKEHHILAGLKKDGNILFCPKDSTAQYYVTQYHQQVLDWKKIIKIAFAKYQGEIHLFAVDNDNMIHISGVLHPFDLKDEEQLSVILDVDGCKDSFTMLTTEHEVVAISFANNDFEPSRKWTDIVQISSGYNVAGLKSDGTVVACGWDFMGQCNVTKWRNIVWVCCSSVRGFVVGLKNDGTVIVSDSYKTPSASTVNGERKVPYFTDVVRIMVDERTIYGITVEGDILSIEYHDKGIIADKGWEFRNYRKLTS